MMETEGSAISSGSESSASSRKRKKEDLGAACTVSSVQVDGNRAERGKTLWIICCCGVVTGIVVALTAAVTVWLKLWDGGLHNQAPSGPADHVCDTGDCHYIAEWFGSTLNRSVDPCENFYEYVCGSSPHEEHTFEAIQTRMGSIVQGGFLATYVPRTGQTAWQKASGLFQSCMNFYKQRKDQREDLRDWMKSLRLDLRDVNDDQFNAAETITRASLEYNAPLLFLFEVSLEEFYQKKRLITFTIHEHDASWYVSMPETDAVEYIDYLHAYGTDNITAEKIAEKLAIYEKEAGLAVASTDVEEEELMSVYEFANNMKELASPGTWIDSFDNYTKNMYNHSSDRIRIDREAMIIATKLAGSRKVGKQGLRTLMAWRILTQLIEYADAGFSPCGPSCAMICNHIVLGPMQVAVMRHYQDLLLADGAPDKIDAMVRHIKASYEKAIRETTWLSEKPRQVALRKLSKMSLKVDDPTHVPNATVVEAIYASMDDVQDRMLHSWFQASRADIRHRLMDQENTLADVFEVNAYYLLTSNEVIVPPSTIQPTLFFPHGPASVNYGGLGATIGHEITHAFDVNGFTIDDEGHDIFWGTNATEELMLEKALCLRRYHNEIDPPRRQDDLDDTLDSENMADFAGMLVTLDAFNGLALSERTMLLPQSAGTALSPEKAFFVAYCASNCDSGVKVFPRYAIGKGRCMVPIMNDARFAKAFGCSDTARMNPKKRCSFW